MVDDLVGDGDSVAGRGVISVGEERTLPKSEMARLAAASAPEARKGP
jgi:hypothetical protein